MKKTFNPRKAAEAQAEYCRKKDFPQFAPKRGRCWRCGQNIYKENDHGTCKTGISVEQAGSELISGCPHCDWGYCE